MVRCRKVVVSRKSKYCGISTLEMEVVTIVMCRTVKRIVILMVRFWTKRENIYEYGEIHDSRECSYNCGEVQHRRGSCYS